MIHLSLLIYIGDESRVGFVDDSIKLSSQFKTNDCMNINDEIHNIIINQSLKTLQYTNFIDYHVNILNLHV